MSCTIDHLRVDVIATVCREFTDARGVRHRVGESGLIRHLGVEWLDREIVIDWEREGARERMCFALAGKEGPGNGRMRGYFEVTEPPPSPRPLRPPRQAPSLPELAVDPVTDPRSYDEGFARVRALVARARFDEAEAQLRVILAGPDPGGCLVERAAGDMVAVAVAHALDPNDAIYEWARDRAVGLWYAWGAQATSGGDGMARLPSIHAAEARLAACDAQRG